MIHDPFSLPKNSMSGGAQPPRTLLVSRSGAPLILPFSFSFFSPFSSWLVVFENGWPPQSALDQPTFVPPFPSRPQSFSTGWQSRKLSRGQKLRHLQNRVVSPFFAQCVIWMGSRQIHPVLTIYRSRRRRRRSRAAVLLSWPPSPTAAAGAAAASRMWPRSQLSLVVGVQPAAQKMAWESRSLYTGYYYCLESTSHSMPVFSCRFCCCLHCPTKPFLHDPIYFGCSAALLPRAEAAFHVSIRICVCAYLGVLLCRK